MKSSSQKRILARAEPTDFVGRDAEVDILLSHAKGKGTSNHLVVLSAPLAGASDLLRQTYDRLFRGQDAVIPFYFEIRADDRSARDAAFRFVYEFLLQTVAFRRRDPDLIDASPGLDEIAELAPPSDGHWIDRLVNAVTLARIGSEDRSFLRNALSAPLRAAAKNASSVVMIDGVHNVRHLEGGEHFLNEVLEVFSRTPLPVVFGGQRRFLFGQVQAEIIDLEAFAFGDAGRFVEKLASRTGVTINDQTRDLIAVQLGGIAGRITSFFGAAAANGDELSGFDDVERVYTDEIFGGHIGRRFDRIVDTMGARDNVLDLLAETMSAPGNKLPAAYWKKRLGLTSVEFTRAVEILHDNELVVLSSGAVSIDITDFALCDYIRARTRLEIHGEPRALVVGSILTENIGRAPALMARFYRQNAAIGLRELLQTFDGRHVPAVLFDYASFKNHLKGADRDKNQKALKDDKHTMRLPQIVYTAHTAAFYPPINELTDLERSAVGLGFVDGSRRDEIVWLAAEVDSKLEASPDVTEFWCDRLEMVAAHCNFSQFKMWLIAPEGFSPAAMEILAARGAFGSSRRQADLLAEMLNAEIAPSPKTLAAEYEFVVPMGDEAEMLTAHTVDEIAKRHDFPPKVANQIKTALVEACINAAEHSLSPDGKIHQKFVVDDDKVTITVTNRGVRLADKIPSTKNEGRRGWGLKLIKGLMGKVDVAETDDGTKITMVKSLKNG